MYVYVRARFLLINCEEVITDTRLGLGSRRGLVGRGLVWIQLSSPQRLTDTTTSSEGMRQRASISSGSDF